MESSKEREVGSEVHKRGQGRDRARVKVSGGRI